MDGQVNKKVLSLVAGRGGGAGSPSEGAPAVRTRYAEIFSRRGVNSVDISHELGEILWCDHAGVSVQGFTREYTHVALLSIKAVHIVVELKKVKVLCHDCFVKAMQVRFDLQ